MNIHDNNNSIFDDIELDEMQKNKNYEIGFKLYRKFFYVVIFIAYGMFAFSREVIPTVMSGAIFLIALVFFVIHAAKTAKAGVMNIKFAKAYSKEWIMPFWIALTIICVIGIICIDSNTREFIMLTATLISNIIVSIFAKKNMRVLTEQLKEDESDE